MFDFKSWIVRRRHKKFIKGYNEGYNWAAGALLRREETPLSLDGKYFDTSLREAVTHFDAGFNVGADSAIQTLIRLGFVEDDRV